MRPIDALIYACVISAGDPMEVALPAVVPRVVRSCSICLRHLGESTKQPETERRSIRSGFFKGRRK